MMQVREAEEQLLELGRRLRAARLGRNEPMALFAERLGVSEGTVRSMERGLPTVQIGTWLNALWLLDRLDDIRHVLEPRESLLDRARAERERRPRQRASRRPA
ncbi:MAG: XRE family transcriptional regulator [Steroidobacteraceae bacterium]|nr:XRE family transcriptional regulator [Steroidobacteraceae bacterium]